jgi:tellurite methyltransferase
VAAGVALSDRWTRFYAAAGDQPRETLLDALARFEAEERGSGLAVDLGAGTGRDTAELLRRGWRVVAVDAHAEAAERLRGLGDRVEVIQARFDDADWPEADLVNASYALPFCDPPAFERCWRRIRDRLAPGGRFCGQLFGIRDEWAGAEDMSFHSRDDVERLLARLEFERLDEVDDVGRTALGESKHWHLFHVVARRP